MGFEGWRDGNGITTVKRDGRVRTVKIEKTTRTSIFIKGPTVFIRKQQFLLHPNKVNNKENCQNQ